MADYPNTQAFVLAQIHVRWLVSGLLLFGAAVGFYIIVAVFRGWWLPTPRTPKAAPELSSGSRKGVFPREPRGHLPIAMTLREFLATWTLPPNLHLEYHGEALRDGTSTVYAMFRGPDSTGKERGAAAMQAFTLIASIDPCALTPEDIAYLTFQIDHSLRILWDHEYKEWTRINGIPIHAPHHSDGSFA